MIDLHTHILPALDDGLRSESEAVEFARIAQQDGVRRLVATPHCKEGSWDNDRRTVLDGVARLRNRLKRERVELVVEPGAEVHLCPHLVARVRDGRAPTLADNGRTLLLELSMTQHPVGLAELLFELQVEDLLVVFAHPERIRYFQDDVSRYEQLVHQGAYGQITTGSILGLFGRKVQQFSRTLMDRGLVHVLASDAHNLKARSPVLSEALAVSETWVGSRRAQQMVLDAPRMLLDGERPELVPVEPPSRWRWISWARRVRKG